MASGSSRTPAAKPDTTTQADEARTAEEPTTAASRSDATKATTDGRDNSTSNDANLRDLTPEGTIATNREQVGPSFKAHCGYCGQPVGPEGQHWDADTNEQVANPHAGVLVVADAWPENQDAQDEAKHEREAEKRDEIAGITEK